MSLKFRLNIIITLVFLFILFLSAGAVVHNARNAISREFQSTADLAINLLTVALVSQQSSDVHDLQTLLIEQFRKLENTRHLQIAVTGINDLPISPLPTQDSVSDTATAPIWFSQLVQPDLIEFRRKLSLPSSVDLQIVVRANPAAEISEVWEETRTQLALLILFALLANVMVFLVASRALRPIDKVLHALSIVEEGEYNTRLPDFTLPELSRLSQKFNHMVGVLAQGQRENHFLAQQMLEIQEQERRQLAHELHDELGQSISAIRALALSIARQNSADITSLHNMANSISVTCQQIHRMIRTMLTRLRPVLLDELGLVIALEQLIDNWNAHHKDIFCGFTHEGIFSGLEDTISINVYRIVQESLTNVARHSQASHVKISLCTDDSCNVLNLIIEDNGIGFEPEQRAHGLGLIGMRERAIGLCGKFTLTTLPGAGVRLVFFLPFKLPDTRTVSAQVYA